MQFVLPIIALLILGVAELSINPTPTPDTKQEIKKETHEKNIETPTLKPQAKINTSVKIDITNTPTEKPQEASPNNNLIYPIAQVISRSENEYILESSDSTQQITDWYKSYIQNNQMNTTSFVTTNTNGNILNKLAGAGNGKEITVEISKQANEVITKIKITF